MLTTVSQFSMVNLWELIELRPYLCQIFYQRSLLLGQLTVYLGVFPPKTESEKIPVNLEQIMLFRKGK